MEARETPCVDFKRDFYAKLSQSDLPKDVCAFANSISNEDKYIIFGIEDKTREIGDVLHKVNLKYYLENKQKMSLWEKLKYWIKK